MKREVNKNRNAQVTVFIIIAIVIVIAIVVMFYFFNKKSTSNEYISSQKLTPQASEALQFSLDCFKETSNSALDLIGNQGGYYKRPKNYLDINSSFIPYYYFNGDLNYPTKTVVEHELENYLDTNIIDCFKNPPAGIKITYSLPNSIVKINENFVSFKVNSQLKIEKDNKIYDLDFGSYPLELESQLNSMLDTAAYYSESHKQDPKLYNVDELLSRINNIDIYIYFDNLDNNTVLLSIMSNKTQEGTYYFRFLNKYTGTELSPAILNQNDSNTNPPPAMPQVKFD